MISLNGKSSLCGCGEGPIGVQLSFKSTVELIKVVALARVVVGLGSSGFVVGDLPRPSPDRSRVVS